MVFLLGSIFYSSSIKTINLNLPAIMNQSNDKTRYNNTTTEKRKVVFTNGCFDVFHLGHLRLLKKCRKLGDYLIIAVNSDDSVRANKGPTRPINSLEHRMELLKELEIADEVVILHDLTPERMLEEIRPDVLVKGPDYKVEDILGRQFAKETVVVDVGCLDITSSKIIDKIKRLGNTENF